ncbi:DUF2071 domain-containing protein [Streptomyces sp. NPDC086989]|uniref:DUF2071 domain-containing protein n=1 Tax=Streptomyces sp. NPDC086989 TaxID=3365764 RepID=UPI0038043CB8
MPWETFPETNLRTYVRRRGGPSGLWFLALEVSHPPGHAHRAAAGDSVLPGAPHGGAARRHAPLRGSAGRRGPRYELEVRTDERIRVGAAAARGEEPTGSVDGGQALTGDPERSSGKHAGALVPLVRPGGSCRSPPRSSRPATPG